MKKPLLIAFMFLFNFSAPNLMAQGGMQFNHTIPNYVQTGTGINQQLQATNTITVEAWCYLTTYSFLPTLVGNYGSSTMQFLLRIDNQRPAFWVEGGSGFRVVNGATIVPLNTWTHLAGVWDGSTLRVYINGVLDGTTSSVTGQFNNSMNPVRIGASLTSEAFSGSIDEVRIWSAARSQAQIQSTMGNCLQNDWSGLLASYSFEEGSGTTVADRTGNGNVGTLVSSPTWTTGIACVTLPVNFVSLSTKAEGSQVAINWKVGAEEQIVQYEIERSPNGNEYEKIGTQLADGRIQYNWTDRTPLLQQAFYRIKAVEASGAFKYSSIIRHTVNPSPNGILIAPNPVKGKEIQFSLSQSTTGRFDIVILNSLGRTFVRRSVEYLGGNTVVNLSLPAEMSAGIYLLQVAALGQEPITQRFIYQP